MDDLGILIDSELEQSPFIQGLKITEGGITSIREYTEGKQRRLILARDPGYEPLPKSLEEMRKNSITKLNHLDNMRRLEILEIENIIGIFTVGSLNEKIKPGDICVPIKYIDLSGNIHTPETPHRELVNYMRQRIQKDIQKHSAVSYIQIPEKETELGRDDLALKGGDILGVRMFTEASVAKLMNKNYAALCIVGFEAGITKYSREQREKNIKIVDECVKRLCKKISETDIILTKLFGGNE